MSSTEIIVNVEEMKLAKITSKILRGWLMGEDSFESRPTRKSLLKILDQIHCTT